MTRVSELKLFGKRPTIGKVVLKFDRHVRAQIVVNFPVAKLPLIRLQGTFEL